MIKYTSRILVLGLTAAVLAIPCSQAFAQSTASTAGSVTGTDPEPPPPPPPPPSTTMQTLLLILQTWG